MTEVLVRFTVIVCCYFVVHVEPMPDASFDSSVAEYYKAHGAIKWTADPTSFCLVTKPVEPPMSFHEAYLTVENIMLQTICVPVVMEVLHCLYRPAYGHVHTLALETFSVSGLHYEAFKVSMSSGASRCNAPGFFTIQEEIFIGGSEPRGPTEHPVPMELDIQHQIPVPTEYQNQLLIPGSAEPHNRPQIPVVNFMDNAEKILADHYATDGCIKWKYDPRPFCESLVSPGDSPALSLQGAYTTVDRIMLERAHCAEIRMEILYCDYAYRDSNEYPGLMRNFVNGVNEEIFDVCTPDWSSRCHAPSVWIIHSEITEGQRLPRRDLDRFSTECVGTISGYSYNEGVAPSFSVSRR